jgi:uncharacterized protein
MKFIDLISRPWPWYVAGPLIGLTVPTLLILGNKSFGISSTLRHACAACLPAKIPFFQYDWKKEIWNMVFVLGIFIGAVLASIFLSNPKDMIIHPELSNFLSEYGIESKVALVPTDLFSWSSLFTLRGFVMMVVGGFMIGFGTRYGGGCTSGHAIMGLSTLQWPSLIATCCFMAGGFIMTHIFLPYILAL